MFKRDRMGALQNHICWKAHLRDYHKACFAEPRPACWLSEELQAELYTVDWGQQTVKLEILTRPGQSACLSIKLRARVC